MLNVNIWPESFCLSRVASIPKKNIYKKIRKKNHKKFF